MCRLKIGLAYPVGRLFRLSLQTHGQEYGIEGDEPVPGNIARQNLAVHLIIDRYEDSHRYYLFAAC